MRYLVTGKFEFIAEDGKVILKGPGITAELKFLNILNKPGGKLRTKFTILNDINGQTHETPVDIFISDWGISGIGIRFTGEERCSNKKFRVTLEYKLLTKTWVISGSINGVVFNINNKELADSIKAFSDKLNLY